MVLYYVYEKGKQSHREYDNIRDAENAIVNAAIYGKRYAEVFRINKTKKGMSKTLVMSCTPKDPKKDHMLCKLVDYRKKS